MNYEETLLKKMKYYFRIVLRNALSSPIQLSKWHLPPSRKMVMLLYSCSWLLVPGVCGSPHKECWFQMPQELSIWTDRLSTGKAWLSPSRQRFLMLGTGHYASEAAWLPIWNPWPREIERWVWDLREDHRFCRRNFTYFTCIHGH